MGAYITEPNWFYLDDAPKFLTLRKVEMSNIKEIQYDKKGFTVVDTVDIEEGRSRELPNSDPGKDDGHMSYQNNPWDKQPTPKTTI